MSELDANHDEEPNTFNGFQAQLEYDLINTQDHIENLWLALERMDAQAPSHNIPKDTWNALIAQKEQVTEYLRRMRIISGMSVEFPNRDERRKILRANRLG